MMRRTLAMLVLMVASFMDLMDAMITNVALPAIRDDLGASSSQLEWTTSAYILLFAVLLIFGGRLGDLLGRRLVFLVGIAGFTVASLSAALATSGHALVISRGVQGAFAALMVPQVLATAQALYQPHERGKIFGAMSALGGLGVLAGQLIGGWLVTANAFGLGWRSVFAINVPIGVVILVLALILVPNTRSERARRLDVVGTLLATLAALALVFGLIEGNSHDWSPLIIAILIAGVVAALAFVGHEKHRERRGRDVLLPMHLFGNRGFAVGSAVQLSNYLGWGSFAIMISIYVQEALHFTALQAGLTMLPVTLGSFAGTALAPLAARLGRTAVVTGALLQAAGFVGYGLVIQYAGPGLSIWALAAPLFLTGVGMIIFAVPLMTVALHDVPTHDAGAASGAFSMFQQLGSVFGVAVVGIAFFGIIGSGVSQPIYQHAIVAGNWITVAAFAVTAVLAALLPRPVKRAPEQVGESAALPAGEPV